MSDSTSDDLNDEAVDSDFDSGSLQRSSGETMSSKPSQPEFDDDGSVDDSTTESVDSVSDGLDIPSDSGSEGSSNFVDVESIDLDPVPEELNTEFPLIHDRGSTHEYRRQIGLFVLPHTERALDKTSMDIEDELGNVADADLREAAVMAGLAHVSEIMDILHDWGYRSNN